MRLFTIVFERLPMVWFLLGLLFNAGGLYLGFDHGLAFVYLFVGWGCCAYGIAVYVLQRMERPKTTDATRLSPNFISDTPAAMSAPAPAARERSTDYYSPTGAESR